MLGAALLVDGPDVGGLGTVLLYLAPLVVLLLPLLRGRFLGERRLLLRSLRRPRRWPMRQPAPQTRAPGLIARGGRLIGTGLAVRPPPASTASA